MIKQRQGIFFNLLTDPFTRFSITKKSTLQQTWRSSLEFIYSHCKINVWLQAWIIIGYTRLIFAYLSFSLQPKQRKIACSVSVSAWTLVAISVERFFAICYPLRSRRWQTLKHAYRSIILIWCSSLLFMSPIAVLSQLIPTSQGE